MSKAPVTVTVQHGPYHVGGTRKSDPTHASTADPHPRDTVCGMDESSLSMKVVGRRRAPKRRDLSYAAPLLDLAVRLRGRRPFIPKGVHVFRSFEEADQWSLRMMTRPSRDRRP